MAEKTYTEKEVRAIVKMTLALSSVLGPFTRRTVLLALDKVLGLMDDEKTE